MSASPEVRIHEYTQERDSDQRFAQAVQIYNHYCLNSPATFASSAMPEEEVNKWKASFFHGAKHHMLLALIPAGSTNRKPIVLGYAYSSVVNARCAYGTSVMSSVYLKPGAQAQGIASSLYEELFERIEAAIPKYHRVYAGITLPNDASVALHKKFGFRQVGLFVEVGNKFDQFWDVAWFQKDLK